MRMTEQQIHDYIDQVSEYDADVIAGMIEKATAPNAGSVYRLNASVTGPDVLEDITKLAILIKVYNDKTAESVGDIKTYADFIEDLNAAASVSDGNVSFDGDVFGDGDKKLATEEYVGDIADVSAKDAVVGEIYATERKPKGNEGTDGHYLFDVGYWYPVNDILTARSDSTNHYVRSHYAFFVPQRMSVEVGDGYSIRVWIAKRGTEEVLDSTEYKAGKTIIYPDAYNYPIIIGVNVKKSDDSVITSGDIASIQSSFRIFFSDIDSIKARVNEIKAAMEPGSMKSATGTHASTYGLLWKTRRTQRMITASGTVTIEIPPEDVSRVSNVYVWQYGVVSGKWALIGNYSEVSIVGRQGSFTLSDQASAFKLSYWMVGENDTASVSPIVCRSDNAMEIIKCPDIREQFTVSGDVDSGGNLINYEYIRFNYETSAGHYTRGHLILPPNYDITGDPVPLLVYCHGTGGMSTWDRVPGRYDTVNIHDQLLYIANEGFAVFDCYPWTDEYYSSSAQISPFAVKPNIDAYVAGIRFVCDRFNVDINRVCVVGFSLGGNMSTWFQQQKEIPIKAVAQFAPTTGWCSTIFGDYFLYESARNLLVQILGLEGEEGATEFVETDNSVGLSEGDDFVEAHLASFAGLNASQIGTHGAKYSDFYDWHRHGEKTKPSWMTDLPDIPAAWLTHAAGAHTPSADCGVPAIVNHPELSRYTDVPVKFWQAFDDVNVSCHANYTIYNWMLNGGSRVWWRTMASGHGGHGALGTSASCEKTSGTTRLGVAYTDMPVAQVEMVDFLFENI